MQFVRGAILGVAAARNQRHHLVAGLEARGASAERNDFAGDLEAWNVAGAGRRRIVAGALRDVRPVDAGGRDLDQDLVLARRRHGPLLRHQRLRPAGLWNADGGHL